MSAQKEKSISLNFRTPTGMVRLHDLDKNKTTLGELKASILKHTQISTSCQRFRVGYPPKELLGKESDTLADLGISNGDSFIVEEISQNKSSTKDNSQPTSNPGPSIPSTNNTSFLVSPPTENLTNGGDDGTAIRRVVNADNSCLFTSLGYLFERDRQRGNQLRKVVSDLIKQDEETYSSTFLGKSPQEYCKWIQNKDSWGGAIELAILSHYYRSEICVFDTQTLRKDLYGQDSNYTNRVYLIYDGIHYDPLALSFAPDAPEEVDITIFLPQDTSFCTKVSSLVEQYHCKKMFTDTTNFSPMSSLPSRIGWRKRCH